MDIAGSALGDLIGWEFNVDWEWDQKEVNLQLTYLADGGRSKGTPSANGKIRRPLALVRGAG